MSISNLHLLELLSDQISVNLLNAIANAVTNSENLIQLLNVTRKQYYDRSTRLLNKGLIRRKNGEFYLTSFGQLVQFLIENSLSVKTLFTVKGDRRIKIRSWGTKGSTEDSHR